MLKHNNAFSQKYRKQNVEARANIKIQVNFYHGAHNTKKHEWQKFMEYDEG